MDASWGTLQGTLLTALAAVVTAAAAYLAAYLRAKAGEAKAAAVLTASNVVDGVVGRHVAAVEQTSTAKGQEKKDAAVEGIREELSGIAKTVGKGILEAAIGNLGARIEGKVLGLKLTKTF